MEKIGKLIKIVDGKGINVDLFHVKKIILNADDEVVKYEVGQILNTKNFQKTPHNPGKMIVESNLLRVKPEFYPNRKTCLYLSENHEYWEDKLRNRLCVCTQVARIKLLNGYVIALDSELVNEDLLTDELACKGYWEGKMSDNPKIEYLFEGEFEVIEILDEY